MSRRPPSSDAHLASLLKKSREQRGKASGLVTPRGKSAEQVRPAPSWIKKVHAKRVADRSTAVNDAQRILDNLKNTTRGRTPTRTPGGSPSSAVSSTPTSRKKRAPSPLRRRPSAGRPEDRKPVRRDPSPSRRSPDTPARHQPVAVSKRRTIASGAAGTAPVTPISTSGRHSPDSAALHNIATSPHRGVVHGNGSASPDPARRHKSPGLGTHKAATSDTPIDVLDVMPGPSGPHASTSSSSWTASSGTNKAVKLGDVSQLAEMMPTAKTPVHRPPPKRRTPGGQSTPPPKSPSLPTSAETTAEIKRAMTTSHNLAPQFNPPSSRLKSAHLSPSTTMSDHETRRQTIEVTQEDMSDPTKAPSPSQFPSPAATSNTDYAVLRVLSPHLAAESEAPIEGGRNRNVSLSESIIAAGMSVEDTDSDLSTESSYDSGDEETGEDEAARAAEAAARAEEEAARERHREAAKEAAAQAKALEEAEARARETAILRAAQLESERAKARAQELEAQRERERQEKAAAEAAERIREQERLLEEARIAAKQAQEEAEARYAKEAAEQEAAAIKIQAQIRRLLAEKNYQEVWRAAVILQVHWARRQTRKARAQLGLLHLNRHRAATKIQSMVRASLQRARFKRFHSYVRLRNAALTIQTWYRHRKRLEREREAAARRTRPDATKQPIFRIHDHIVPGIKDSRRISQGGTPLSPPLPSTSSPSAVSPLPMSMAQPAMKTSPFRQQVTHHISAAIKVQAAFRGYSARRRCDQRRVHRWLASLGCERYAPMFAKSHITYPTLAHLDQQALQEVGVTPPQTQMMLAKSALMPKGRPPLVPAPPTSSENLTSWLARVGLRPWKNALISTVGGIDTLVALGPRLMSLSIPVGIRLQLRARLGEEPRTLPPSSPLRTTPASPVKSPVATSPVVASPSPPRGEESPVPPESAGKRPASVEPLNSSLWSKDSTAAVDGDQADVPQTPVGGLVLSAPTKDTAMWIFFEEVGTASNRRKSSVSDRRASTNSVPGYSRQKTAEVLTDQSPIDGNPRFRFTSGAQYFIHIYIAQDPTHGFWFDKVESLIIRNIRSNAKTAAEVGAAEVELTDPIVKTMERGVLHILVKWNPAQHMTDLLRKRTGAENAIFFTLVFKCRMKGKYPRMDLDKEVQCRMSAAGAKFRKRRFLSSTSRFKIPDRLPPWVTKMAQNARDEYGTHGLLILFKKRTPRKGSSALAGSVSGSTKPVTSSGLSLPSTKAADLDTSAASQSAASPVAGGDATMSHATPTHATELAAEAASPIVTPATGDHDNDKHKKKHGKSKDKKDKRTKKKTLTPVPAPPLPPRD